jgi:hypothetical protein
MLRWRMFSTLLVVTALAATMTVAPALGGTADDSVGVVDQTQGLWYLRDPVTGATTSFYFGNPGDFPIMGDWDCDGIDTPGLYRQSDGFVYLRNSNTVGVADIRFFFGDPGDTPLAGDFNRDGCDTVSIYRPSQARIFVINELGANDGGLGAADFVFYFGNIGDKPFTGDFNINRQDTVGLHRESTGFVYYRNTLTTGIADNDFFFGDPGDQIITGRWAQNPTPGPDTVGIFRPSNGTFYLRFSNSQGNADVSFPYGNSNMAAVAGDFGTLPGGDAPPPGETPPMETFVTMSKDFFQDRWHGWAATEPVEMTWSNDLYGWIGRVGSDSVMLLRSQSGDWSGYIGSESVVLSGNISDAEWAGFVGSDPITLKGGVYSVATVGSIGSAPVSLTYAADIENVKGDGPRSIGALIPILYDEFNFTH